MRRNKLTKFAGIFATVVLAFSSMTVCAEESGVYITQKGDTLNKIAQNIYGDKTRWREIYEANKDVIKDPNMIYVNQHLTIPNTVIDNSQPAPQDTPDEWTETSPEWQAAGESYVEQNGLTFYEGTSYQTQGYRYNLDDPSRYEFVGAAGNINSITIRDAEKEGYQVVTISTTLSGHVADQFDSDLGAINYMGLFLPKPYFFDVYTGKCFPAASTDGDVDLVNTINLTWGDISYSIDYIEESSWDESDWSDTDDNGWFYCMMTNNSTYTYVIPKGYDGLAMLVFPLKTAGVDTNRQYNEFTNTDRYVMDVWEEGDGYYLMRVSNLYNILNG